MTTWAIAINLLLVAALVIAFANSGKLLGPKPRHEGDGNTPYESGMLPFERASERMTVLYWRFAVLFVVFDVDLALLLPWAAGAASAGAGQALAATLFTAVVALMLAYFWRKEALECR